MSADRGAYICQSQSLNIHITNPNFGKLTSMHFYAWKQGLKTGMYYLRTRPKADAIQFTVDQTALTKSKKSAADAAEAAVTPVKASAGAGIMAPSTAVQSLDYAAEAVCESCSA